MTNKKKKQSPRGEEGLLRNILRTEKDKLLLCAADATGCVRFVLNYSPNTSCWGNNVGGTCVSISQTKDKNIAAI